MNKAEIQSIQDRLSEWLHEMRLVQYCHYSAANHFRQLHYILGIPVLILTTIVGTSVGSSVFFTTSENIEIVVKIFISFLSIGAAVLSSIQAFLRFDQRAEKHHTAGIQYGSLRWEIEESLTLLEKTSDDLRKPLTTARKRIDDLAAISPVIPQKIWNRREQLIKGHVA